MIVEIYQGAVFQTVLEFPIAYSPYDGSARFADGLDRIRRQKAKLDRLAPGCRCEVVVRPRAGFTLSSRQGWGPLGRPLMATTSSYAFGTVARGPAASAGLRVAW